MLFSLCQTKSPLKIKKKLKYCHWNQVLSCFGHIRAFTAIVNGTGMLKNQHQMEQFCGSINYQI